MKTGKELKINKFKNYNVVFGSVNNKTPKAIYINISSWVEPKENSFVSYNRPIKDIIKKTKQTLYNKFDSDENKLYVNERTIVDLDIRESGIRYGKRSFMNCEITLFLIDEIPLTSDIILDSLNGVVNELIYQVFDDDRVFSFNKKKK